MRNGLAMALLLLAFGACITLPASFAPSRSGHKPQVVATPEQIRVYRTGLPQEPYEEIGTVMYEYGGELKQVLTEMKKAASLNGGNAIIQLKITPASTIGTVVRFVPGKSGKK